MGEERSPPSHGGGCRQKFPFPFPDYWASFRHLQKKSAAFMQTQAHDHPVAADVRKRIFPVATKSASSLRRLRRSLPNPGADDVRRRIPSAWQKASKPSNPPPHVGGYQTVVADEVTRRILRPSEPGNPPPHVGGYGATPRLTPSGAFWITNASKHPFKPKKTTSLPRWLRRVNGIFRAWKNTVTKATPSSSGRTLWRNVHAAGSRPPFTPRSANSCSTPPPGNTFSAPPTA